MGKYQHLYHKFLASGNALQVYEDTKLIYTSDKKMLVPLLEYIELFAPYHQKVVIFDKIMGNAAALLCARANCSEVYSPLGSEPAIKTLRKYSISYHITNVVPYIEKPGTSEICPMEKLSLGKTPEEFYKVVQLDKPKTTC